MTTPSLDRGRPGRLAAAALRHLLAAGFAVCAQLLLLPLCGRLEAQNAAEAPGGARPAVNPGASASAPPPPSNVGAGEIARAIREAGKELEELEARLTREAQEALEKVTAETQAASELRDKEQKLLEKLAGLEREIETVEEKTAAVEAAHAASNETLRAAREELETRAATLGERFAGSIAAAQDPAILELAAEAGNPAGPLADRVGALLDSYEKVLLQARTATIAQIPVRTGGAGGKIEKLSVLRLGLVGGYYARPSRKEGGFVIESGDRNGALAAESRGLSPEEQAMIAALVARPEAGGVLPADLTGGVALAALQATDTPRSWFERGGVWMWPLLAIAILAGFLVLERGLVLLFRATGIRRAMDRVVRLVEEGRLEAAEAAAARTHGAPGAILRAALETRETERATLEGVVEEAYLRQAPRFHRRLGFITLLASLAPLAGFLGMAAGLLATFKVLNAAGGGDAGLVAAGLSQALVTTQAGLLIAIPCLLCRGLLGALAEKALADLDVGSLAITIALLKLREAPVEMAETA